jgi:hypothetical protein
MMCHSKNVIDVLVRIDATAKISYVMAIIQFFTENAILGINVLSGKN